MKRQFLGRSPKRRESSEGDKGQIERPDAQDPARVEAAQIETSTGGPFTKHEPGDQVGTQSKEEINPIGPSPKDGDKKIGQPTRIPGGSVELEGPGCGMKYKYPQECEKSEPIEFRSIEATSNWRSWRN